LGWPAAALIHFRRALAVDPSAIEVHFNLGNTLREIGALDDAVAALGRAAALDPGHIRARTDLGVALRDLGRTEEALATSDAAIACDGDYTDAYWNRALSLLLSGDFERGWPAYEWRWRATAMTTRNLSAQQWDGDGPAHAIAPCRTRPWRLPAVHPLRATGVGKRCHGDGRVSGAARRQGGKLRRGLRSLTARRGAAAV